MCLASSSTLAIIIFGARLLGFLLLFFYETLVGKKLMPTYMPMMMRRWLLVWV